MTLNNLNKLWSKFYKHPQEISRFFLMKFSIFIHFFSSTWWNLRVSSAAVQWNHSIWRFQICFTFDKSTSSSDEWFCFDYFIILIQLSKEDEAKRYETKNFMDLNDLFTLGKIENSFGSNVSSFLLGPFASYQSDGWVQTIYIYSIIS